jgi:hypothetical protein
MKNVAVSLPLFHAHQTGESDDVVRGRDLVRNRHDARKNVSHEAISRERLESVLAVYLGQGTPRDRLAGPVLKPPEWVGTLLFVKLPLKGSPPTAHPELSPWPLPAVWDE